MSDQPPQDPDPLPPASGWVTAATPAVEVAPAGSFVIAGVGARVVAYFVDASLLSSSRRS